MEIKRKILPVCSVVRTIVEIIKDLNKLLTSEIERLNIAQTGMDQPGSNFKMPEQNQCQSAEPCNLSKDAVEDLAGETAKALDFEIGGSVAQIIRGLGGKIFYQDLFELENSNDGSILIRGQNDFEIRLFKYGNEARRRFTLAHELGHYCLHFVLPLSDGQEMKPIKVARYSQSGASPDRVEWEANWFAAAFLMPKRSFVSDWDRCDHNVYVMASKYRVSLAAIKVRAEALEVF